MTMHDGTAGDRAPRTTWTPSRLVTVRIWREHAAGESEYRGSAREVVSGAFRNVRDWPDLAAFMIARMEEDESAMTGQSLVEL